MTILEDNKRAYNKMINTIQGEQEYRDKRNAHKILIKKDSII
jgi:hypothetical protein